MTVSDMMIVSLGYADDIIVDILTDRIATSSTYKQLYEKPKFGLLIISCFGTTMGVKKCVGKII
jgi:hypothetical protein